MSRETLEAAFKDLQGDVGFFLGYGRGVEFDEGKWTGPQQSAITRCVKGGLRNFYHCGVDWSFLKPVRTLGIDADQFTITLPEDFGGLEGDIELSLSGSATFRTLTPGPIGTVYRAQADFPDSTGAPEVVCVEPIKGTTPQHGQRSQLRVWPKADQAYSLMFQMYLNPEYLSGQHPFAYGGAEHAETLLESCLAVAEKLLDDSATVHAMEFEKRLAVSRDLDRRKKAHYLGYNANRSRHPWNRRDRHLYGPVVTYAGVEPE